MSAESETSSNVTAEAMNGDGATPLVSVIVPVYGVERYLDACVEGLVGQTYRNLEILLVDDGSPDRCPAMCDAWTARDERIRVIHKANGGLSDARNVGLAKATGDYIYFVDSDDMVERNLIERAMATMRDYDADLVMFQFDTISEDGKPLASSYKHNHYDDVIIPGRGDQGAGQGRDRRVFLVVRRGGVDLPQSRVLLPRRAQDRGHGPYLQCDRRVASRRAHSRSAVPLPHAPRIHHRRLEHAADPRLGEGHG